MTTEHKNSINAEIDNLMVTYIKILEMTDIMNKEYIEIDKKKLIEAVFVAGKEIVNLRYEFEAVFDAIVKCKEK